MKRKICKLYTGKSASELVKVTFDLQVKEKKNNVDGKNHIKKFTESIIRNGWNTDK